MSVNIKKGFDELSKTGIEFAIYKDVGECYCFEDIGLFKKPDPTHKGCLGTGRARSVIITEKLRHIYTGVNNSSNIEIQEFELNKGMYSVIYFPAKYSLNQADFIAYLKTDSNNNVIKPYQPKYFCKIIAVDNFSYNDFRFIAVTVKRVDHVAFEEVITIG